MHHIMAELHQDHIHLARLLTILEQQSQRFNSEDDDPDLLLMMDIADYIHSYPDLVHHPKEDLIYNAFAQQSDQAKDVVDSLLSQHHAMPTATTDFQDMLHNVANGASIIDKATLKSSVDTFIALQKAHMNIEEEQLFPLINETLSDQDWLALEQNLSDAKDPLFGDKILDHYQNLYQCIEQQQAQQ